MSDSNGTKGGGRVFRTQREKRDRAVLQHEEKKKADEGKAQKYADFFKGDLAEEILEDLREKYRPEGRRFRFPHQGDAAPLCPFRAAIEDGEAAVVTYIQTMIRKGQKR